MNSKNFEIIEHLNQEQILDLHNLYQKEWWSEGRVLSDIKRMLSQSDIILGICESKNKKLVAFARILTDFVYKALIFDVIVAPAHRDKGLGKVLIERIISHPDLMKVQHLELYCLPELVPFYKKWGFTEKLGKLVFMRRTK